MRKPSRFRLWSALLAAGACTSSPIAPQDARPTALDARPLDAPALDAPPVDGGPAGGVATEIDCVTSATPPPSLVTASALKYNPVDTTIHRGGVVKFTMPADEDVASNVAGLVVPFSTTKCLTFGTPGTYTFHCTPHAFVGTIIVQP